MFALVALQWLIHHRHQLLCSLLPVGCICLGFSRSLRLLLKLIFYFIFLRLIIITINLYVEANILLNDVAQEFKILRFAINLRPSGRLIGACLRTLIQTIDQISELGWLCCLDKHLLLRFIVTQHSWFSIRWKALFLTIRKYRRVLIQVLIVFGASHFKHGQISLLSLYWLLFQSVFPLVLDGVEFMNSVVDLVHELI